MMSPLLLSFCIISFAFCANADPDYYWRDYHGTIPEDALPGPILDGERTFFATGAIYKYGRVYGRLHENATQVKVLTHFLSDAPHGHGHDDTIYDSDAIIQVLCSPNPEKFQWVATTSETFGEITDYLVPAGYDGPVQYIGMLNNITGKVAEYENGRSLYYVTKDAESVVISKSFSVLVYKP